jgi:hypothetical protein
MLAHNQGDLLNTARLGQAMAVEPRTIATAGTAVPCGVPDTHPAKDATHSHLELLVKLQNFSVEYTIW